MKEFEAFITVRVPFTKDGDSMDCDSGRARVSPTDEYDDSPDGWVWDIAADERAPNDAGMMLAASDVVGTLLEAGSKASTASATIEKLKESLTGLVEWFDGAAPDDTPTMMLSNARALLATIEATS